MSNQAHSQQRGDNDSCEIFNGARCPTYCWSQGHGDLEIRVKLSEGTTQADICVQLKKDFIYVSMKSRWPHRYLLHTHYEEERCAIMGTLEHEIDTESAYWMVDKDSSCLVIYLDKMEDMWWTKLTTDDEPIELGPKNYTVPMDQLDVGARMAVDKLITDQMRKLTMTSDMLPDS